SMDPLTFLTQERLKPTSSGNLISRIVGGTNTKEGEWPWQVRAHGHVCGASVISTRWLVSAAHCFLDSDSIRYSAPSRIIVHPQYDQSISDYDIALLEMETPVFFSELVQPICLPSSSRVFLYGTVCYVTGWGAIKENTELERAAGKPVGSWSYCTRTSFET
uniref:Peptidase S1 domain-containing protein n=1 Tax=Pavo cristatus TaxID=9049 RepID=A0A8C9LB00_PAVCR